MKTQYYIAGGMLVMSSLMMYEGGITISKFLGNIVILLGLVYFLDNHKEVKKDGMVRKKRSWRRTRCTGYN